MKKGRWAAAMVGLAAAAAAGPAAAQDESGIYVGGAVGVSHWTLTCTIANVPCDDKDGAWRAFGGYRFNRYWSAEIGGFDLGSSTGNGPLNGGQGTFEHSTYGGDASAVLTLPIVGSLSAVGKLGIHLSRTTLVQSVNGVEVFRNSTTNHNYLLGAGLQYNFGKLGVQAGWQRYNNVGTEGTTLVEDKVDVYSVGLLWQL
jgi:hypothetical protein